MATRKQRRRREKEHRHEYDVVYLDAAGNEIEPPPEAERSSANGKRPAPATQAKPSGGGWRSVQPPSWRRVVKRGLIFAPIFLATLLLLGGDKLTMAGAITQTLFLLAVFIPFSYLMDRFVWRQHLKRSARG